LSRSETKWLKSVNTLCTSNARGGLQDGTESLWVPATFTFRRGTLRIVPSDFDWEKANLRDDQLDNFFAQHSNRELVVEGVSADEVGSFKLDISGSFQLEVFPHDSLSDEHWRLLKPGVDERHFVVTGLGIQD
jgi:hypothetical protein